MISYLDLKDFFKQQGYRVIMAADAETRVLQTENEKQISHIPAGGVSIALEPIAKAAGAVYVARGKTEEEKKEKRVLISDSQGQYALRRLFLTKEEMDAYYYGFSNQTLWPLSHVAFEPPEFKIEWYEGFKKINQRFARTIKEEVKGKTFIWIHDYQLCLVPKYLEKPKNSLVTMFWHIPWPTWETFRILPQRKEILESMLNCDFLAFHRGYHVRNFLATVNRELEVRIDEETNKVYYNKHVTTVRNLPLGIDGDVIKSLLEEGERETMLTKAVKNLLVGDHKDNTLSSYFEKQKVILGIDRLDYTKGLILRLRAIDKLFDKYPQYKEKITYLGIIAPSREVIPSYIELKKKFKTIVGEINLKHGTKTWKPIHISYEVFPRKDVINFYRKSAVCLVTPRDDGMNLVSKEFVLASSNSEDPGMLVLSRFAGSAIDLTQAVIVNPYDTNELTEGIKKALEMGKSEKVSRIKYMSNVLMDRNIYAWATDFVREATTASREK